MWISSWGCCLKLIAFYFNNKLPVGGGVCIHMNEAVSDKYNYFVWLHHTSENVTPGAKIIKKNTKLDSKQMSNVPC